MKKTKKLSEFINILLKEDYYVPPPESSYETRPLEQDKPVSLDQVVDRYIVRYEKESIPTIDDYEQEIFESKIKNYSDVLLEALNEAGENNQQDPSKESEIASTLGPETNIGSGTTKKEKSEQEKINVSTPQINLDQFAKSVARLVNNFEVLLNPKDVVLNRVENYIKVNYDSRTAEELMNILDQNYSLRTQEKNSENKSDVPETYAVGALSTEV